MAPGAGGYTRLSIDLIAGSGALRNAVVTTEGEQIRRVELPGREPSRVCVHGLGATSPAYFAEIAGLALLAVVAAAAAAFSATTVRRAVQHRAAAAGRAG